jgi:hypothetical protein
MLVHQGRFVAGSCGHHSTVYIMIGCKLVFRLRDILYSLLRYGVKIKAEVGVNTQTVELINWKQPLKK